MFHVNCAEKNRRQNLKRTCNGWQVKISIVIPAYNSEKTLEQCLIALFGQTYPQDLYEVIVVDDGSTDSTAKLLEALPVQYIYQPNQGPATARNRGAAAAVGEIILFTDADCVPDANWAAEMVRPFDDPEVMAVKGAYRNRQKSIVARFAQIEFEERFEMLKKVESIDMIDTYSAGFRREVFKELGGFDTSFPCANNEDTELSYRMSKLGHKMVFNPEAVVCHLNHPASVARYFKLKFSRGYWRMVVYKSFPGKMAKDSYTPQALKLQILSLLCLIAELPAAIFFPGPGLGLLLFTGLVLVGLMMPFTVFALKRDQVVGFCSPFLLVLRAFSIGSGAVWGIIHSGARR